MGRRLSSGVRGRSRSARTRLIRALEGGGYEPVTDGLGTIRLRNCPFDALTDAHRALVCGTNLALAEGIVEGAGAIGFEPMLDIQPGLCCVTFRERTA
jgi:predicted ArsR family transcriptional regulator